MPFPLLHRKKLHGILLDTPQDGTERCRECGGVCCSSFAAVEISWEEYELLRSLGASRLQLSLYGPHRLEIDYGCEFLVQGRCSIYEQRPAICRRFTCRD
ncbi:MAG: YkgJ family cysteine cluster protein [Desulfuromonadales bacterium]|nr:YkgJ family cysteine cluster protein [Desulfuromonadales bacterium]